MHKLISSQNFSGNTVAFWHSTGSDPLVQTVAPVTASTSSNGADWHLGVLELPVSGRSDTTEDFYFSGVYIESGSLTTTVSGPGGSAVASTKAAVATTAPVTSGGSIALWQQCGGEGWTGSGTCVDGATCVFNTPYFSQCLASTSKRSEAAIPIIHKYQQCGGINWDGQGVCEAGTSCVDDGALKDIYAQCL
jgi:hypothetical protein